MCYAFSWCLCGFFLDIFQIWLAEKMAFNIKPPECVGLHRKVTHEFCIKFASSLRWMTWNTFDQDADVPIDPSSVQLNKSCSSKACIWFSKLLLRKMRLWLNPNKDDTFLWEFLSCWFFLDLCPLINKRILLNKCITSKSEAKKPQWQVVEQHW